MSLSFVLYMFFFFIVYVGDVSDEQQSTQGFLEFLSQNSDAGDSDIVHSEPEAETILMSCYHGIQNNTTVHPNGVESCGPSDRR